MVTKAIPNYGESEIHFWMPFEFTQVDRELRAKPRKGWSRAGGRAES